MFCTIESHENIKSRPPQSNLKMTENSWSVPCPMLVTSKGTKLMVDHQNSRVEGNMVAGKEKER